MATGAIDEACEVAGEMGDTGLIGKRTADCGGVVSRLRFLEGVVGREAGGVGGMSPVISESDSSAVMRVLIAPSADTEYMSQFSSCNESALSVCVRSELLEALIS